MAKKVRKRNLSRLEWAAQENPLLAHYFKLTEGQLLMCRYCDYVTRQELNALRHLKFVHPDSNETPVEEEQAKEK